MKKSEATDIEDKLINYKWFALYIDKAKEQVEWVTDTTIYNHILNFLTKSWWSIVRHRTTPKVMKTC